MLTSIAIIVLSGLFMGRLFSKLKLPGLLGMILAGILLSPHALNLLDPSLLNISSDLRQIALVIILTRAGLSLNLGDLKKVGRPAVLLCFVPACAEIIGTMLLAPPLLGVSLLEAAITGSVIAAVSPAVIVPRMIRLMENGYGRDHSIPQLLLAGASVEDVFVIVVFSALTSLASSGSFSALSLLQIPVSILTGVLAGMVTGLGLHAFFRSCPLRDTVKILILLSVSFLLLELQNRLEGTVPLSGLLAIMSLGIFLKRRSPDLARTLCDEYSLLWIPAEIFLFVLVGVTVDLQYAFAAGAPAIVLVLGALMFRMAGVALSLVKTRLTGSEKLFCMIAYTPKATVQAAIGAIPLSMGLACGQKVLTVAVLAILITAPLGAVGIDKLYKKLLTALA
ncbi:sodium:proton antiporter [uncultured Faecalibaculum sp.]|uniref:cation:proton antiporter n=1 Tax=uncultured Faecalibaculum sp. TaxID=1729681 RepID=UPI00267499ED|nr:cation:proton antiporter [uncultured Faecalibaculum sp.]